MVTFEDRERAFEAKFASDEASDFKAHARRDRLLALWAGEQFGLSGDALEDYVLTVWRADLKHPGDEDVLQRVLLDFDHRNVRVSEPDVRHRMDEFLARARREIAEGV